MAELFHTKLINDPNLVFYYRGQDLVDSSNGRFNLTNNNSVAFNPAKFDLGFDFGTSNSTKFLNNNNAVLSPLSDYTIGMQVKLQTEIASGFYEFLHIENNTNKHVIYIQYDYNAGTPRLNFQQDKWVVIGYNARHTITLGTVLTYHLVVTMVSRVMQIYLNGLPVGTTATFSVPDYTTGDTATNNQLLIGAGSTVGTGTRVNYASSIQDDIAGFSRGLSAQEVLAWYNDTSLIRTFHLRPRSFAPGLAR